MRILVNNEWFDSMVSASLYEHEFETMVIRYASTIFPEYHMVSFKVPVDSEHDRKVPDLALIDKSYRHWWVVEVEMAHHSLRGHVIPQIETFATGNYGHQHSDHIMHQSSFLDHDSIRNLVKWSPPRVLVIVNQDAPTWIAPVHNLGGLLMVLQIFRSEKNDYIIRINGDVLTEFLPMLVTTCRLDPAIPRLLQIDSPASLALNPGEAISVIFEDGVTDWTCLGTASQVWLSPIGNNPLSARHEYEIQKDAEGRLYFNAR